MPAHGRRVACTVPASVTGASARLPAVCVGSIATLERRIDRRTRLVACNWLGRVRVCRRRQLPDRGAAGSWHASATTDAAVSGRRRRACTRSVTARLSWIPSDSDACTDAPRSSSGACSGTSSRDADASSLIAGSRGGARRDGEPPSGWSLRVARSDANSRPRGCATTRLPKSSGALRSGRPTSRRRRTLRDQLHELECRRHDTPAGTCRREQPSVAALKPRRYLQARS